MSYRIRVPDKSVPLDEAHLGSWGDRFLLSLYDHRRGLMVGAGVVLVAGLIVGGVLWTDQQRLAASVELLNRGTRLLVEQPPDKPSEAEQNLKGAVATLKQLTEQYPRSQAAAMGFYQLGNALMQQNDVAGAIEAYQKGLLAYAGQPMMTGLIQQRLGYAYLLKGDREAAVKAFTAVTEIPGALNRDHALFELARIEESQGRPEGAIAHYQDLIKSYPNSPLASEATVRMKVMEVKKTADGQPAPSASSTPPAAAPNKAAKPAPPSKTKSK